MTALHPVYHELNLGPEPKQSNASSSVLDDDWRDVGVRAGLYLWRLLQLCSQKAKTHISNCLMA